MSYSNLSVSYIGLMERLHWRSGHMNLGRYDDMHVCSRVQCSHLAAFRAGDAGIISPSKDVVEFVPTPADVRDHSLISNVDRTSPSEYRQHPRQQPLIAMPPILQPMSRVLSDLTLSAAPSHGNLTSPHFTSYTTCLNFPRHGLFCLDMGIRA